MFSDQTGAGDERQSQKRAAPSSGSATVYVLLFWHDRAVVFVRVPRSLEDPRLVQHVVVLAHTREIVHVRISNVTSSMLIICYTGMQ